MSNVDWSKAPEGATHWEPESDEWYSPWMMLNDEGWHWWPSSSVGWMKCRTTMNEIRVRAMIPRHPAWNGEGLPPAGTVCEAFYMGSPQGVVTVRYSGECMILWSDDRQSEQCGCAEHYIFRPIRTPEQIAAEERENEIKKMRKIATAAWRFAQDGDDWLDVICEALYDAGYRKQEQPE